MTSDDVFRARLESTIASLRYWVPQIADTARIEEAQAPGFWKIMVTPHVAGACPFELMLRSNQSFGLVVDRETYENLAAGTFNAFVPLVEAISEGRVIERQIVSAATGELRRVSMIVDLPDGQSWEVGRDVGPPLETDQGLELENRDRHFLPYRR